MEVEIRLARLHEAQAKIRESGARFKVLACGRRFGKTTIAVDSLCDALIAGKSAAYFAPTYRMGSEVWREVKRLMMPLLRDWNEHEWRMELVTGGVFECWSLANGAAETVRGRKYHFVVVDEAALFESGDVWHSAIRPLLTDYAGGALFASTPRGRNWFWQLYLQGMSAAFPEWESWCLPTGSNPYIQAAEIEAARTGMPERFFRQEYEAVFLDDGGVVFRNVDKVCRGEQEDANAIEPPSRQVRQEEQEEDFSPQSHREEEALTPSPSPSGRGEQGEIAESRETCFFGVDWGKDNDFTCVSVMTRDGQQIHLERFNQIGWAVQRGRLAALYERFKPRVILAEENSIGSVNIEALQAEGLPVRGFMTTSKSKGPLIDELALAMEQETIVLLNNPVLKHELMAYELKRNRSGWSYGAPSSGHDDTVMATALSLWASKRYGGVSISFV
ncbi:MAG: terminase large subunit [Chloroflexi bacterium]|nr:terminase large subunit [Chloroflexota bacterium]MCC6895246.1 hypothetical protein [Anaerolineae bacterium]